MNPIVLFIKRLMVALRFIFMFGILSITLLAQKKEKVINLHHADSLVGLEIGGEPVRELIGNVKFSQDNVVVTCQKAMQYLRSNKVWLEGEVEVIDDDVRMVGSRGMYYGDSKIAEAFERVMLEDGTTTLRANYGKYFLKEKKAYFVTNVSVEDSSSVLTADEFTYFREEQRSIASGNVRIVDPRNSITLFGNHFEHYRKDRYSKMTQQPKAIQIDTTAEGVYDTLIVTSVSMESYQDTIDRLVATDSVVIVRNEMAAEAGVSIFYPKLDSIILRREPFVWYSTAQQNDSQISGDSIFFKLNNRKLQTIFVRGSATAISRADTRYLNRFNQMTGQEITLRFTENALQRMDADKTATSLYYLFDERRPNGLNKTTGDQISISFSQGKIDKIKVTAGVEGQYFPEKMVMSKEHEYNLQGFKWRENRPGRNDVQNGRRALLK